MLRLGASALLLLLAGCSTITNTDSGCSTLRHPPGTKSSESTHVGITIKRNTRPQFAIWKCPNNSQG